MIAAMHTMGKAIPVVHSLQFFYGGCFFLCLSSLFPAVLATCSATFNAENFIPTPPQLCTSITLFCTFLSWHCMTTNFTLCNRFNEQNNNSAHAWCFFVHFFAVPAQQRGKMTKFEVYLRTAGDGKAIIIFYHLCL